MQLGMGDVGWILKSLLMPEVKSLCHAIALSPGLSHIEQSDLPGSARDHFSRIGKCTSGMRSSNASLAHTNPRCSHLGHLQEILRFLSESCQSTANPGRWRSIFLFALSFPRLLDL